MRSLLGVNLPYFFGSYGHDLAPSARYPGWPCDFDLLRAYRPLLEAKQLGLDAVRIWLCEGAEGLILDAQGHVVGPHPRLLESMRLLEEGAAVAGIRVYWTLLDANSASRDGDAITRSILVDRDQSARFAEKVVAKIASALDPKVLFGLEIVNEPEVVTESCRDVRADQSVPSVGWDTIGSMVAVAREAALAERADLLVTAGTGHVFLPELWKSGAGLRAIDIHMYHAEGGLPSRDDLARYVGDASIAGDEIPLIAGECGVLKPAIEEEHVLRNFAINADKSEYAAAFLWKLEGDLVDSKSKARPLTSMARSLRAALKTRPATGFRD